jgi:hypothetical protein
MMVAMKASRAAARRYLPGSPFHAAAPARPAETLAVGDQVTHDKHGLGVILGVEDHAGNCVGARKDPPFRLAWQLITAVRGFCRGSRAFGARWQGTSSQVAR